MGACQRLAQGLWFGQQHLHSANGLLPETALAIAQVILPHAYEVFLVAELADLLDIGKKRSRQCRSVVA